MKNLIYLLLAGSLFIACNGSGEGGSATTESKTTEPNKSEQGAPAGQTPQENTSTPESNAKTNIPPPSPNDPPPGNAAFNFETKKHDFGLITSEDQVEYVFKFKNTGTEPLIISEARGSCGCTVPEYPKEAIEVGAESEITVSFRPNSNQHGVTPKTVKIIANTNPSVTTLEITSDVQIPK